MEEEKAKCTGCGIEAQECYCMACIAAGAGSTDEELYGD